MIATDKKCSYCHGEITEMFKNEDGEYCVPSCAYMDKRFVKGEEVGPELQEAYSKHIANCKAFNYFKEDKKMKKNKSKPIYEDWYKSSKDPSVLHKVMIFETFDYCTCDGYKHRKKCKHIDQAKDMIEFNNL
jgi:hypothetical protein